MNKESTSKKNTILNDISIYTFGSQATQIISLIAGVLTRNFLGPIQMGMWSTLQIIMDYSKYTTLGITEAVSREIPYFQGKGDTTRADKIKNVVASFSTLAAILTSFLIIICAFILRNKLPQGFFLGLLFVALLVILQRINNLIISLLRAYKQFKLVSKQMIWSAIVNAVLIALLSYRFKLYGFMWAMVLSFLFNICYIVLQYDFQFRYTVNKKTLLGLISFGLPLMLLQIVGSLLKSIDKIIIVKMLGFEAMGFYSIAIMGSNYLSQIPNSIGIVMVPHFHQRYGIRDSIQDVKNYVDKSVRGFCGIMPVFIGLSWIATPVFVSLVMPQYLPGIQAAKYLMLGTYFISLTQSYGNFVVVIKKHLWVFPVTIISSLIAIAANILVIRLGAGIGCVAAVTSFIFFLNFFLLFFLSSQWLYSRNESWKTLLSILSRFFFLLGTLLALDHLIQGGNLWLIAGIQSVVFLIIHAIFIIKLDREFQIMLFLKDKLHNVFSALKKESNHESH